MYKRAVFGFATMLMAGLFVIGGATPAAATVSPQCSGTGDFLKSGHHYTAADAGVDKIPRKDDVKWAGQITGVTGEQSYSGHIEVELPPPFGTVTVNDWSGKTDSTGNTGTKHYDIPGFVPANVEFAVKGAHTQGTVTCTGSVKVVLEGSTFGPFSAATLALTLLCGAGLILAGLQGNYAGS